MTELKIDQVSRIFPARQGNPPTRALEPTNLDVGNNDFGKSIAVFLNGKVLPEPNPRGERIVDDSFLLCFNAHDQEVTFTMPPGDYARQWTVELDTTSPTGTAERVVDPGDKVALSGRSIVILRKTL